MFKSKKEELELDKVTIEKDVKEWIKLLQEKRELDIKAAQLENKIFDRLREIEKALEGLK